jgi:RNA polymerase sigma-70 factor, ECF subfamily
MKPDNEFEQLLPPRQRAAFQDADVAALVALMRADVTAEMPPMREWFRGPGDVGRFLATRVLTGPGRFTLIPVEANGQPAFGTYLRGEDGEWVAHAIQVLGIAAGDAPGRVTRISMFLDGGLFPAFGLPLTLPAVPAARTERTPCCSP